MVTPVTIMIDEHTTHTTTTHKLGFGYREAARVLSRHVSRARTQSEDGRGYYFTSLARSLSVSRLPAAAEHAKEAASVGRGGVVAIKQVE